MPLYNALHTPLYLTQAFIKCIPKRYREENILKIEKNEFFSYLNKKIIVICSCFKGDHSTERKRKDRFMPSSELLNEDHDDNGETSQTQIKSQQIPNKSMIKTKRANRHVSNPEVSVMFFKSWV